MSGDPLEERRLRLEQAEREARGDFSKPAPKPQPTVKMAQRQADADWAKYKAARDDDDEGDPNKMLNRQHNNLRAQAKIDMSLLALLDTSQPREER